MNDKGRPPGYAAHEWVGEVLQFWFSELEESDWWAGCARVDAMIRSRFLKLHEWLASGGGGDIVQARSLLAAVIVLDQFSRHLFRGDAQAYAADPLARRLARRAIAQRHDQGMRPEERLFLYLPFEHSEDKADQAFAVELISELGREDWTSYTIAHKLLIDRFGRFPHRNAVLGRKSTEAEIAAMNEPMGSFDRK
ncbi:MAG: DUF924 family protein [Steroidobacteraceae bacterium]